MESGIPPRGARAAHVLLDAVVSQSSTASDAENTRAMATALSDLIRGARRGANGVDTAGDDAGSAHVPGTSDIVGASVVCLSWLTTQLAAATRQEPEAVIGAMREFMDAATVRQDARDVDRVDE